MNNNPLKSIIEVRHYTRSGNADFIKNPSPAALHAAGFGGVGSSKLKNRYLAELGTTSRCRRFDKKQVTQIGKEIVGSGNRNWNGKEDASIEVFEEARDRISRNVQEGAIGALAISCWGFGFRALVRGTSPLINRTEKLNREELQKI